MTGEFSVHDRSFHKSKWWPFPALGTGLLLWIPVVFGSGWLAPAAHCEPYFSAWKGVSCAACHVNQTGGYARNEFGKSYGEGLTTFDWEGIGEILRPPVKSGARRVVLSGDLHLLYDQDLNDPSISHFTNGRQELYFACYLNNAVAGVYTYRSSGSREIYGLISGLPSNAYLKFGLFQLPYGLMLADDQSFIRTPLGFSFERADTGVEVGITPDPCFVKVAVFNNYDNPSDSGKILSAYAGLTRPAFTLGGSVYNETSVSGSTQRFGVFGWGKVWRLVALGEYDLGFKPDSLDPADRTLAAHASVEADLGASVYLRLTREFLNPTYAVGDEMSRSAIGLHFFPVQNTQVLVQLQLIEPVTGGSQAALTLDAHEFF